MYLRSRFSASEFASSCNLPRECGNHSPSSSLYSRGTQTGSRKAFQFTAAFSARKGVFGLPLFFCNCMGSLTGFILLRVAPAAALHFTWLRNSEDCYGSHHGRLGHSKDPGRVGIWYVLFMVWSCQPANVQLGLAGVGGCLPISFELVKPQKYTSTDPRWQYKITMYQRILRQLSASFIFLK